MVDFRKLREKSEKPKLVDPVEIFRRLPKPAGINDLYTSQAEVLQQWFQRRKDRDVVVKLHTGGGKTLVGLLMAQSTLNELSEPVLYLSPTVQLVSQTVEKARQLGIQAAPYEKGKPFDESFVNGKGLLVATYKALFNGRSRFKLRGDHNAQRVGAVILDDAHTSFSELRDAFSLEVDRAGSPEDFAALADLFRYAFKEASRLGTYDDVLQGYDMGTLEIPYWAWFEKLDAVRAIIHGEKEAYKFEWPLIRDSLHLCHGLISKTSFTITPVLPLVDLFPTFTDAPRRIYMSATIADDSEIVRSFDADVASVRSPLTSRSLAGISERMILIPDLMPFAMNISEMCGELLRWCADSQQLGAVLLTPSDKKAAEWVSVGTVAVGSDQVDALVRALQERRTSGPAIFSNRYDGIDLPGDSCRLLVMYGLPTGTSNYELFRAGALYGGATITRMLAQRIEQGIGRGARGAGDHCAVVLAGGDLSGWVAKEANFKFLTSATRAQMHIGVELSAEIQDTSDVFATVERSFDRDEDWVKFHAEALAELVEEDVADDASYALAAVERRAFDNWRDGYPERGIGRVEEALGGSLAGLDAQTQGWLLQFAARISQHWGNEEKASSLQQNAFGRNRNLTRPRVQPAYRPLPVPGEQARALATLVASYRIRKGLIRTFEEVVSKLHPAASANQFEQALADLGQMLGFVTERHDVVGKGPDLLWLLPNKTALVIEAKSRKLGKNAFTKEQHGQLLVAAEWFAANYPDVQAIRVSVHPNNHATEPAAAASSFALTYEGLQRLVSDARTLLTTLCESQLPASQLEAECEKLLSNSTLSADSLPKTYLSPFVVRL